MGRQLRTAAVLTEQSSSDRRLIKWTRATLDEDDDEASGGRAEFQDFFVVILIKQDVTTLRQIFKKKKTGANVFPRRCIKSSSS